MKNYAEKEKKLDNALKRLSLMTGKLTKMSKDISLLNLEKNQLLREKEESAINFENLSKKHQELSSELKKIDRNVKDKFSSQNSFNQKVDELNQETETLIDEIEKWQM